MQSMEGLTDIQKETVQNYTNIITQRTLPPIRETSSDARRRRSSAPAGRSHQPSNDLHLRPTWRMQDTLRSGTSSPYPNRRIKRHQFLEIMSKAKASNDLSELKKFYFETFESFTNICSTFKNDPLSDDINKEDAGLELELVYGVLDALREVPSSIQKHFLKALTNALLEESPSLLPGDKIRSLFILVQSPVFLSQSSYSVLAHVLKGITELPSCEHRILAFWSRSLEVSRYRMIVNFVTQFLTVRQFPPLDRSLPPLNTTKWWIPAATKVLAVLYAGSSVTPQILPYTEFYNTALDHLDLMKEYRRWQTAKTSDTFTYCQYPFVLSIVAKRFILTKDAEQQMILTARRSLMNKIATHQAPHIDVFFLNISVRRAKLIQDTLMQLNLHKSDLKKKLKVNFEGEPGLDMGGLTKEWFLLLVKEIFGPENKMFVYHKKTRLFWFSISGPGQLREYNLIGVLMGLAIYNASILDVRFPQICFKKLLCPAVVPQHEDAIVGISKNITLKDFEDIMPEIGHSLREILNYEGNVEEDMFLTFEVSFEEYGESHSYNLKEDGSEIPVTNENREEFVKLYIDWVMNSAIYERFRAFYLGFHTVMASNALIMLRPEEVETLVCGCPNFDLGKLRRIAEYDGYTDSHPTIGMLWKYLIDMSQEQQKKFLLFTTGSDRIPVGGVSEMPFKITKWSGGTNMLPQAHTCFNQLMLPPYETKEELQHKLNIALDYAEGFGLE